MNAGNRAEGETTLCIGTSGEEGEGGEESQGHAMLRLWLLNGQQTAYQYPSIKS